VEKSRIIRTTSAPQVYLPIRHTCHDTRVRGQISVTLADTGIIINGTEPKLKIPLFQACFKQSGALEDFGKERGLELLNGKQIPFMHQESMR